MTDPTVDRTPSADRTPSLRAVAAEQLRTAGLAVRREALAGTLILALSTLVVAALYWVASLRSLLDESFVEGLILEPAQLGGVAVALAILFPLAVWKGERPFGESQLWTLPVDHRRHALTKVASGCVWLVALLGSAMLWLVIMVLISGGTLGTDEVHLLITDRVGAAAGVAGATESVRWSTPWWQWVLPFTAPTAGYLTATAFLLATKRPLRWIAGAWLPVLAIGVLI